MNRTFKNILIAITLTLSAVSGFAQTEVEVEQKIDQPVVPRDPPKDAVEVKDFKSLPAISGRWTSPNGNMQDFEIDFAKDNFIWYMPGKKYSRRASSACNKAILGVTSVTETDSTYYVRATVKEDTLPTCPKGGAVWKFEFSKTSKTGLFWRDTGDFKLVF